MTHFSAKFSIHLSLLQLVIAILVLWFIFGDPEIYLADLFWKTGPAPWEQVDLIYTPDRNDPLTEKEFPDVSSLDECRIWASHQAGQHNDPHLERGSYTCRVGHTPIFGSARVYRLSLE